MADFKPFSRLVYCQLTDMSKNELFTVGTDNRIFEREYLSSFPEGTNPIYRKQTEHDCSCCKNFIRNFGNVISITDGKVKTVWDNGEDLPYPYDVVSAHMATFVRTQPIVGIFRTKELRYGAESNRELLENGTVHVWNHFWGEVNPRHRSPSPDSSIGEYNSAVQVFRRGLVEFKNSAFSEVKDLIEQKALYRGEEFSHAIQEFSQAYSKARKLNSQDFEHFVWEHAGKPFSRFKNTVIGTLIADLSSGMDIDQAVRAFEQKVAPTNYKRPTSLVTAKMVEQAMKTIKELDLEQALERRHATLRDISVNNVLWVDTQVKDLMKSSLELSLLSEVKPKKIKEIIAQDISIDAFVMGILPKARTIELLLKNEHNGNFVSLTAPVHKDVSKLFKWGNDFGWSYDGNITDSIKEKVKRAGGNVTNAALRVSLAWSNFDDLDLHVFEPSAEHIYFGNKTSKSGGKLDVDMNALRGSSRNPVENISWIKTPRFSGRPIKVMVNQYNRRETENIGFTVEIEYKGEIQHLIYSKSMQPGSWQEVCSLIISERDELEVKPAAQINSSEISVEKWGLKTNNFVKVQTILLSPNHWDEKAVGNKHWFFVLDGCNNPEPIRGIYNEFLRPELEQHRKVFEILGNKTKCQPSNEQLSGLGFSSTKTETVTVRVNDGQSIRNFNVTF